MLSVLVFSSVAAIIHDSEKKRKKSNVLLDVLNDSRLQVAGKKDTERKFQSLEVIGENRDVSNSFV